MNTYPLMTAVELSVDFETLTPAPIDPSTVTLEVRKPDGTIANYTTCDFSNPSTGQFAIVISADQSGAWIYNWQGSGNVEVSTGDVYFNVSMSATVAG